MIKNETRESAHLKSRVKDLSVVPNLVSFTGLFTAITPIAKLDKNPDTGFYDPILIRDTDSLIANFGDPRIDPEKYIDLYTIMQVIGNGTSCYVCKVDSGDTGIYEFAFVPESCLINNEVTSEEGAEVTRTVIDDDIDKITDQNGFDLATTNNEKKPNEQLATILSVNNKYTLAKLFGRIDAAPASPATDTGDEDTCNVKSKGDYANETGDHIHVMIEETAAAVIDVAEALASDSITTDAGEISCRVPDDSDLSGTASNCTVSIVNDTDNRHLDVTISRGQHNYVAHVEYAEGATYVSFDAINNADILGEDSIKVNDLVEFSMVNNAEAVSNLSFDVLDNDRLDFALVGADEVVGTPAVYKVTVWDDSKPAEEAGSEDNPYTKEDVSDKDTVNNDESNVYVTIVNLCEVDTKLAGGKADQPLREWELTPETYSIDHEPVDPEDTSVGTRQFNIKVLVNDSGMPKKLVVKNASLDPEYGRENIQLHAVSPEDLSESEREKYKDKSVFESDALDRKYTIMSMQNGESTKIGSDMYLVEWLSVGNKYKLRVSFSDTSISNPVVQEASRQSTSIIAYSSMSEPLDISCTLTQAKPYSLKLFYLNVAVASNGNTLGTAKVKLEPTTTNQSLVNNLNSSLQTYARFELADADTKSACEVKESGKNSIVKLLLDKYAAYSGEGSKRQRSNLADNPTSLYEPAVLSEPNFRVTLQNYIDAQMQYKDKKYVGCLMADFTAPVTHTLDGTAMYEDNEKAVMPLDPDERRALHYNLKQIACERKDSTVIISTPLTKGHEDPNTWFTMDEACNWVASQGDYADLWEYGAGNTVDYSIQSFYLEIYYSWLNLQCTKIDNGLAKSVKVKVAPANLVVNNILTSWRERGIQYPVAGDQYGTLTDQATILQNPKTKLERDQLVQYRINPIWDTGTRGVQIYGNETLNAGYTDLNAAHIARTLVYIRSRTDEYTETLKFLINSQILWDTWKNYVTAYILEPLQAANAISSFRLTMGNDTTSRAEIANRMIKGNIELTFYQSAEIFDLSFIVYSSATTVEEANPL